MRTIKTAITKRGKRLAMVVKPNGTYGVWVQASNYLLGRDVKYWGYVVTNVTLQEAEKTFNRRKA